MDIDRSDRTGEESGAVMAGDMCLIIGRAVARVVAVDILERPNCHGELWVKILAQEKLKEQIFYEGDGMVSLICVRSGKPQVLFQGMVMELRAFALGDFSIIEITARTASCLMDLQEMNLSYQDTEMTFHEIVQMLVGFFPGAQALIQVPDQPLGCIAVQYQETFWAFLKRLSAAQGAFVYVDSTSSALCLYIGLPESKAEADFDQLPYTIARSTAPEDIWCTLQGQTVSYVKAYDILKLGERVLFHGRELYTGSVRRTLEGGLLVSQYGLRFKEGMQARKYGNPLLVGVSVNGAVEEVRRNKVKVVMETDAVQNCRGKHYFPFSTVSASPDGSGWYCMPKTGDRVRIFFPGSDKTEGYAIANIQGNSAPAPESPMVDPGIKDITTPDGNTVKFIENGIQLSAGGGCGSVTLKNDGKAEIHAVQDIVIGAGNEIMAATEGELELTAGEEIVLKSDGGADISIKGDTIEIHASNIMNNC